jgi:hypothetical protein
VAALEPRSSDGKISGVFHPSFVQAAEAMANVVAERLVAQLESSGFVIMRKPIKASGTDDNPGRRGFGA